MAAFTNAELAAILHNAVADIKAKDGISDIPYSRPQLWAAAQAIRDVLDSSAFRTSISSAIDTAISPATMTAAQKRRLFGRVMQAMFGGEVT